MIEKMKVVHIVAAQTQKTELLDALRALGIVHFAEKADADQTYLERFAALSRLITVLEEQGVSEVEAETLDDDQFKVLFDELNACLERKKALEAERAAAVSACDTLAGWGSFSPAEIKELKAQGFELHFCRVDKKLLASLEADKEVRFLRLAPVGKQQTVAILGALPASCAAGEFIPPEKSLDEYRQEIADCERGLSECGAQLKAAAKHLPSFREQLLKTQNDADYSSVRNTSESGDGLVWLTGYLPVDEAERFKAAAAKEHWAWAMDDPAADDDKVPTKIKYTKVTRLIAPVFDILGTVPGYREYDISFWFLGFFTLFFAMIIGDAGYGCLFLLTAAALTVKSKKPSDAVQLLWVLSIATIVWGAMTGTWFGLEGAMDVPLLRSLVVPTFANYPEYFNVTTTQQQNSVMKFCFILGTVQLSLACVMNIRRKTREKDLSWVADLGWLCAICALYFVVLYLVIGEQVNLTPIAAVVLLGFVLVVCFGGMSPDKTFAQGLKAGLGNAFTVFLNTISAFGNIMSYIRLFAVGMAYCYFVVFRMVFQFIAGFSPDSVNFAPDIDSYFSFVITMFFAFGLTFEVPIFVMVLNRVGMASAKRLKKIRPYVIVGAFVVAAIFTPPDVLSQLLLALPLVVLYEFGIVLVKVFGRKDDSDEDETSESADDR